MRTLEHGRPYRWNCSKRFLGRNVSRPHPRGCEWETVRAGGGLTACPYFVPRILSERLATLIDFDGGQPGVDVHVSALTGYLWAGGCVRDSRVGGLWTLVSSEEECAFPAGRAPLCAQFRANGLGDSGGRGGADGARSIGASPLLLKWSGWGWRLKSGIVRVFRVPWR